MKTSELSGAALDWAVAKCEPDDTASIYFDENGEPICHDDWPDNQEFKPSTDWAQGGPIIEQEKITLEWTGEDWMGYIRHDEESFGHTPLVAAMRCYVASKLGDEVEVPEQLK